MFLICFRNKQQRSLSKILGKKKKTKKREKIASRGNLQLFLKGSLGKDFKKDKSLLRTVCPLACGGPIRQQRREDEWVDSFEGPVEPALKELKTAALT